jgi:uncharacterized protein (UPF0335 family)
MINGLGSNPQVYQTNLSEDKTSAASNGVNETNAQKAQPQAEDELQAFESDDLDDFESIANTENIHKSDEEKAIDKVNKQLEKSEKQYNQQLETCMKQIEQLRKQMKDIDEQRRAVLEQMMSGGDAQSVMSSLNQLSSQKKAVLNNINEILLNIETIQNTIKSNQEDAQDTINEINETINQTKALQTMQNALQNTSGEITPDMGLGDVIATLGNSFVGVINSDKEGNAAFSNGVSQAWCADFVTSIVKTAYESTGKTVPSGFGSSSVSNLMSWAQSNGRFIQTAGKSNKAGIITGQIQPGDLIIQKENGSSHTGIVTKVYPDGSYDTVEGNSSDAVKNRHYTANDGKLTGFIKMT